VGGVCIFVNGCVGGVYADRQLKTTRLPASLESGRVITFETELISVNKVRVTVEACDKVITFDWSLPVNASAGLPGLGGLEGMPGAGGGGALTAQTEKVALYFFTCLSHPGVSVTVDKV